MEKIGSFIQKYFNSVIFILGSSLYNLTILGISARQNDADFLYFNTIVVIILSTYFAIENTFHLHFGRVLFIQVSNKDESQSGKEKTVSMGINILKTYFSISILILILIFVALNFFFDDYQNYLILFFISSLLISASGYYSIQLTAFDRIKKLHLITGLSKMLFVITSIITYYLIEIDKIFVTYVILIIFSFIQFIGLKFSAKKNSDEFYSKTNYNSCNKNFISLCKPPLKQSLIFICSFITFKLYIIIGNKFISKDILNSIALLQSFFSISLMIGGMYMVLNMNLFNKIGNDLKFKLYVKSLKFSTLIYIIAFTSIFGINTFILPILKYESVDYTVILILGITYLFENILGVATTLYLYMQKIVYFNSGLISALFLALIYCYLFLFVEKDLEEEVIISIPFFVQLLYNYWRYPLRLKNELSITNSQL